MSIGGIVKVEVDTSVAAGTLLTALVSGLTFSTEQDYGAVFEINASGQIEVTNDGSGNGSQHILKCDYVPPVDDYQIYSNHPAGSTVSGRTSIAAVIYKDDVNGYDTVSFSGNNNQWRQVHLNSGANNVAVGFSDQDTNPETTEADLTIEFLASGKFTTCVGNAQLDGANNIDSITGGDKFIGLGVYGNSVGCYLGSFGVQWRQILAVDNRWSNNGDSIEVTCQGVGSSGAILTLNSERDGSGTSVIQTVTSQTDELIVYTVNQGALTSGEVYLFIESNGNKTTHGFEINVGLAQPGTSGFLVENLVSQGAVTTNLSEMGTNTSGITEFGNARMGVVDNGNAEIHEYDLDALETRLRILTLGGLNTTENDSEDPCWMGNGELSVVCEDNSNYFIHVFDYPDIALGDTTIVAKETHTVALPGGANNSGGEALSYNRATRTWYLGGEGEQAGTLQKFYKIKRPISNFTNFSHADAQLEVTEPFDAEILSGDLSGMFFHEASGTVVLTSHTASNLKQLDPEGDGTVISTKALSLTGNQWEGAQNIGGGDNVIAVSEGNVTERFDYPVVATPVSLDDVEGVAAGTSSVSDITSISQLNNVEGISLGVSSSGAILSKTILNNEFAISSGSSSVEDILPKTILNNVEGISAGVSSTTQIESTSSLNDVDGVSLGVSSSEPISPRAVLSNADAISLGTTENEDIAVGQSLNNVEGVSAGIASTENITPHSVLLNVDGISMGTFSVAPIEASSELENVEGISSGVSSSNPILPKVQLNNVEGISAGTSSSNTISLGQSLADVEAVSLGTSSSEIIFPHSVLSNVEGISFGVFSVSDISVGQTLNDVEGVSPGINSSAPILPRVQLNDVEGISAGVESSDPLGDRLSLNSEEGISLGTYSVEPIVTHTSLTNAEGISLSTSSLGELNYLPGNIILSSYSRSNNWHSISKTIYLT